MVLFKNNINGNQFFKATTLGRKVIPPLDRMIVLSCAVSPTVREADIVHKLILVGRKHLVEEPSVRVIMTPWSFSHRCVDTAARFITWST
jgi:hypothetical protein